MVTAPARVSEPRRRSVEPGRPSTIFDTDHVNGCAHCDVEVGPGDRQLITDQGEEYPDDAPMMRVATTRLAALNASTRMSRSDLNFTELPFLDY